MLFLPTIPTMCEIGTIFLWDTATGARLNQGMPHEYIYCTEGAESGASGCCPPPPGHRRADGSIDGADDAPACVSAEHVRGPT